MQACDRCHARKTRCDRQLPQCSACRKAGTPCLHADKLRQRSMPRGYVDGIEARVQQLTAENIQLRQQLHRASLSSQEKEIDSTNNKTGPSGATAGAPPSINNTQQKTGKSTDSTCNTPADNIIAVEMGHLSLVATGETRYLGSGSGMGLANMISSAISTQSRMILPAECSLSDTPSPSGAPEGATDSHRPSLADAKPLVDAYFQHAHITFPLLHRPSFMGTVEKIYAEPGYYESHASEAFTFDMVLAIGSSNFNRLDEPTTSASTFYAIALSKVQRVMAMDGLTVLKAILLVSQHGIFSNLRDTGASIWHLIGIGARLCFEQGLHLEQGKLSGGTWHRSDTVTFADEMKKRCFWCLYNLDRIVAVTLGRPLAIHDEDIDVSLPSHLDDDQLSIEHHVEVNINPDRPTQLSPFLHLIRIRRLSGQILNTFYNRKHRRSISIEEKMQVRMRFHREIVAWKADTKLLHLTSRNRDQTYVSSFLTEEWYNAVYNNAMLLLYRPSPYLPHPTTSLGPNNEEAELIVLLNTAKASIESYSTLRSLRRLNYSWITLHGVFLAGVAYIYSLGRLIRDPAQRGSIPEIISIVEVTRACSNVLVAICERWNVSRRSCDLFDKLSNTVIMESMAATSGSRYNEGHSESGSRTDSTYNPLDSQRLPSDSNADSAAYRSLLEEDTFGSTPMLDQIFSMEEFRQDAPTFDFASGRESSYSNEPRSSFAQDWPFETSIDEQSGFNYSMHDDVAQGRTN
ncbi:hypothetical protein BU24DRAFT_477195 [Aaosphaeria arxii CBS 175.79]|uniref:Zn(2)-C6 fungal-type domain-containing protein n=1 Tax=Aaosphaeria arxii CBS 175.79 TaxID=1450172 RepID=A0A6A5Y494_9PLEO|nr:uncharacterized protein BU24DRAFT_477195 [Aaosphaeria arxii CBS 175.79]KAF2020076.1 hypothetical protein BU24DRAFT_477195 [Aaosphaeria arxii CBS 175.79]